MTDIKVYKSRQVGGNITVISTGQTKIVIDYGENLPGNEVVEEYSIDWEEEHVDAVFFTHYHADHMGRIAEIPDDIPLYMSEAAYMIMVNYCRKAGDRETLKRLEHGGSVHFIHELGSTLVKDITVETYRVDHSAFDSFMFYVITPDKTILHTGDYRDTGRCERSIRDTITRLIKKDGKRSVDILVTEGTTIGTGYTGPAYSEYQMEDDLAKLFTEHRHVFLVITSTNADSQLTFYRAAVRNGMGFYTSGYGLDQLAVFGEFSKEYEDPYNFNLSWPVLKKNESDNVSAKYKRAFAGQREHMRNEGFVAVVTERDEDLFEEFADVDPILIYSMWRGYIDEEIGKDAYSPQLDEFCRRHDAMHFHMSGHATPGLIASVIECTDPVEEIIPIHTGCPEGFLELPISDGQKGKIRI